MLGSKGSILPFFLNQIKLKKKIVVTDVRATRFCITLEQACNYVKYIFNNSLGSEIFVPKIRSIKINDLAYLVSKKVHYGKLRTNEKLHEKLISTNENNLILYSNKNFLF